MAEMLLINPRRRRKTTRRKKTTARKRRRNPVRRTRRAPVARKRRRVRRKANPAFRATAIKSQLKTATTGALGALGLDVILAYLPLPAAVTGGYIGKVTKAAGAIALGIVANKVGVSAANATRMAEGALTVQLHGIGRELMTQFAPGVAMSAYLDSGMGYYGSGWNPNESGGALPDGLNAYMDSSNGFESQGLDAYVSGEEMY